MRSASSLANMVYTDGLVALFAFGGIYAVGHLRLERRSSSACSASCSPSPAPSARFLGGRLDDRIGPKRVVIGALIALVLTSLAILSVDATHIGFVFEVAPPTPGDGLFASTGERTYLVLGALIGAVAGPLQAASRTLMVRVAPRERMTQFFGLFALSGKVTSFIGPFAVALLTSVSGSQRIGISVLVVFFAGGAVLLSRVEPKRD